MPARRGVFPLRVCERGLTSARVHRGIAFGVACNADIWFSVPVCRSMFTLEGRNASCSNDLRLGRPPVQEPPPPQPIPPQPEEPDDDEDEEDEDGQGHAQQQLG